MVEVLKNGGIAPGGLNFDSKLRRGSFDLEDLFIGYISGMDTFAKGLLVAASLVNDGRIETFIKDRYASYRSGIGKSIIESTVGFEELTTYAMDNDQIVNQSSKQEWLETVVNDVIYNI